MPSQLGRTFSVASFFAVGLLWLTAAGCKVVPVDAPSEMSEVILPDYRIGAPDVLLIDAANLVPRPPYRIAPLDGLLIRVTILDPQKDQLPNQLLKGQPIDGLYRVDVAGELDLGFDYGSVLVAKLTWPSAVTSSRGSAWLATCSRGRSSASVSCVPSVLCAIMVRRLSRTSRASRRSAAKSGSGCPGSRLGMWTCRSRATC